MSAPATYVSAAKAEKLAQLMAAQIEGSSHFSKMRELRRAERHGERQVVLRLLVAVHTDDVAVVLVGGDKSGNWVHCEVAVPTADNCYDDFLRRQK